MKQIFKTIAYGIISCVILLVLFSQLETTGTSSEITYTEFLEMTEHGDIEKVVIDGDILKIYPYDSTDYYETEYIEDTDFVNYLQEQEVEVTKETNSNSSIGFWSVISAFLPFILILWLFSILFRRTSITETGSEPDNSGIGNIFNVGKNKSKLYKETDTGIKFADVAGQEEAKESLTEIIDYLHNADKYNTIGAKLPKGALLVGPPGTGKTLLAKAVAGEAGVPFYSVTGSNFVEMFVGVGASRVRDLFEEAKKNAPCIIFIDEIDAIGKNRGSGARASGNDEREQTLNQLLTEMDGFDSSKAIVVLAATNRPEILDKALLRPGRFDRRVIVDRPDLKGREAILKVHIKDVCIDETVDLRAIANATAGAVGADLANIINEAALRAVRMKRSAVSQEDLMESVETVFAGKEKKDRVMNEKERKIVAYHEVGHAVIAALQKNSSPVQKITIVPRTMGSLGYTMQVPEEEKYLSSKEEMTEELRTLIGGRAAEEVFFNIVTTGASNDIEKVSKLAKQMITVYGMNDKFDMVAFETMNNYYLESSSFRDCSEEFSAVIDRETVKLVTKCHREVRKMLENNQELIHEVAAYLLEKENITGDEFMEIFRKYHPEGEEIDIPVVEEVYDDFIEQPVRKAKENRFDAPKLDVQKTEAKRSVEDKKPEKPKKQEDTPKVENKAPTPSEKTPSREDNQKKDTTKNDVPKKDNQNKDKQQKQDVSKKEESVNTSDKKNEQKSEEPKKEVPVVEEVKPVEPVITEPIINVEQNDFEEPIEQPAEDMMDSFDNPNFVDNSEPEEPPMPDFDFPFDDDEIKKAENKAETKTEEKQDKKPDVKAEAKPEPKKDNPPKDEPKEKPAFEAPKPLQKKKKKKSGSLVKPVEQKENKPSDMDLLMNSVKNNPKDLANKKNGVYVNKDEEKKNENILTPESRAEDFRNKKPDTEPPKQADEVTEDDY